MTTRIDTDIEYVPHFMVDGTYPDPAQRTAMLWQVHKRIGDKDRPTIMGNGCNLHSDNIGVEFTTRPAYSADELEHNIQESAALAEEFTGCALVPVDQLDISDMVPFISLNTDMTHLFMRFGCSPDFIFHPSRGVMRRSVPRAVKDSGWRELGFHIHIDLPGGSEHAAPFARALAESLPHTTPAVDYAPWYRLPGTFRPKPYGVEYRSLGATAVAVAAEVYRTVDSMLNNHS